MGEAFRAMVTNSARVTFRDSSRLPLELPSRIPRAVTIQDAERTNPS